MGFFKTRPSTADTVQAGKLNSDRARGPSGNRNERMKTIGFFGSPRSKFSTTNRYSSRFLEPLPLGWGASNGAPTAKRRRVNDDRRRSPESSPVFQLAMTCLFVMDLLLTGSAL